MQPVFDLMTHLGMTLESELLAPFITSDHSYNNIIWIHNKKLPRKALEVLQHANPPNYDTFETNVPGLKGLLENIIDSQVLELKSCLLDDWDKSWDQLMEYDNWTAQQYMLFGSSSPLTPNVTSYLEVIYGSNFTGVYDFALSEIFLDIINFQHENPIKRFPIEGGADTLVSGAAGFLSKKVKCGRRVTSVSPNNPEDSDFPRTIELTFSGGEKSTYSHVISTVPFTCLSLVDTSKLNLSWPTETALRSLRYIDSVKIAIKFTERWWGGSPNKQLGGKPTTDRPMHSVIYPSYGIGGSSAVLIADCTWGQDAARIGSMVEEDEVHPYSFTTILRDLAEMHDIRDPTTGGIDYDVLPGVLIGHHAWNWGTSEFSSCRLPAKLELEPVANKDIRRVCILWTQQPVYSTARSNFYAPTSWLVGASSSTFRSLYEIFIAEGQEDLIARLIADDSPFKSAAKYEINLDQTAKQVGIGQAMRQQ
ncbi:Flavin containing amine oxidoreductase, partial [Rhizoctonia solani]